MRSNCPHTGYGERRDVLIARRQPQRVHRVLDVAVELPESLCIDAVLGLLELVADLLHLRGREILGELRGELLVSLQDRALRGHAILDVAAHVLLRVELRLLREESRAETVGDARVADVFGIEAGHDPKERRLARSVGPENTDLGVRIKGERDPAQDLALRRDDLFELIHLVDELRRHVNTVPNDSIPLSHDPGEAP